MLDEETDGDNYLIRGGFRSNLGGSDNIYCTMSLSLPCSMILHASFPHSDGKLKEADQILAINGQPLDQTVTHQQAIGILQSASERVQLTVARGPIPQLASPAVSRTPSAASTLSANSSAVQIHF